MIQLNNIDMSESVTYNTNAQPEIHGYFTDAVVEDRIGLANEEVFRLAGKYLHAKLTKLCPGFKWLKCHLYETAFDDMTFIYKNHVFSVLLKVYYNGEEIVDEEQEHAFLKQTKSNNFVPCAFPIIIKETDSSKKISIKTRTGFNLFNYRTGNEINPLKIVSDFPMRTHRSWYELGLISVEVITNALKEKKNIRLSDFVYYDPENSKTCPILRWCNEEGKECKCAVKYFKNIEELKSADIDKIIKSTTPRLCSIDYFAPVIIDCKKESAYRNNDVNIYYSKDVFIKVNDVQ